MKALVASEGNTAIVKEVPLPEPEDNEILVKVYSVALNPVDSLYVANPPTPKIVGRVIGSDFAGKVEKIGAKVTQWSIGDRVTGFVQGATSVNPRPGAFAEYAVLEADLAIRVPDDMSFDEAATVPLCSLTAAQALFIRLGLNPPFEFPATERQLVGERPAVLIYSAATSVGLFAIELARIARTPAGKPYRVFATASPKHHQLLLDKGVEAVFDYRSPTWPEDVYKASGGISAALDCISEDESTRNVSKTYVNSGGILAVIRKSSWYSEGLKDGVTPIYSAVWSGLGHEIHYNGEILPKNDDWKDFTVKFFKYLSGRQMHLDPRSTRHFSIPPRVMLGGLENVVPHAFPLLGYGKVVDRDQGGPAELTKPISAEKLVFRVIRS